MNEPCQDCGLNVAPCTGAPPREHDGFIEGGCVGECEQHEGRWEHYMVRDAVWRAAGMPILGGEHSGEGILCIRCLERRLGRELTRADFTTAPINDPGHPWETPLLGARLRA